MQLYCFDSENVTKEYRFVAIWLSIALTYGYAMFSSQFLKYTYALGALNFNFSIKFELWKIEMFSFIFAVLTSTNFITCIDPFLAPPYTGSADVQLRGTD